jgi:phospholipase/carboxylesterase
LSPLHPADIDLPPLSGGTPQRLLVMLHGAGSSPGRIVAAAIAWQLKFRSARAVLLAAPHAGARAPGTTSRRYWIDPGEYPVQAASMRHAAERLQERIAALQRENDLGCPQTLVVGFSQGASVALELAFAPTRVAGVVVGFAARLYRIPVDGDQVPAMVHLVHGRLDSVVPVVHAETALRRLGAINAAATLDILEDAGHGIDQDHLNIATQRVMQTVFAAHRARRGQRLH